MFAWALVSDFEPSGHDLTLDLSFSVKRPVWDWDYVHHQQAHACASLR